MQFYKQVTYRDSIIFLAASAYFDSCLRASPEDFGRTSLIGMSFMISRYIDMEISGKQKLGNMGSVPVSTTLRSKSHRLKDSFGGSIPARSNGQKSFVTNEKSIIPKKSIRKLRKVEFFLSFDKLKQL